MQKQKDLKILVKLPVKMGDTIMAAYFLRAVKKAFPDCQLDVIVARGLEDLLTLMTYVDNHHLFSKREFPGPKGNYRFGKSIAAKCRYDVFFCLPFSFSSALAGYFTGSKKRIGYKREHRGFLLTQAVVRPPGMHIVEEFNYLLESCTGTRVEFEPLNFSIDLKPSFDFSDKPKIVLNIKSGPPSRSIPVVKGISLVRDFLDKYPHEILLTGAPNEKDYIQEVKNEFEDEERVINLAGKTSLLELVYAIGRSECMVTTDSGNAHIANAVGTPTVVLFGAAHPHRAKPYDSSISKFLRLEEMECVPCESEHCKYSDNRCLANIDNVAIVSAMDSLMV